MLKFESPFHVTVFCIGQYGAFCELALDLYSSVIITLFFYKMVGYCKSGNVHKNLIFANIRRFVLPN